MKNTKANILLVEDDTHVRLLLEENLSMAGYEVTTAIDGVDALASFQKSIFDLCLFDVMLPKIDGFQVAREIRTINPDASFIFITAKSMSTDKIEGFKIGCDDYITKPFNIDVLLLRVEALLKRIKSGKTEMLDKIAFGKSEVNVKERLLNVKNKTIKLSSKETELLQMLAANTDEVVSRSDLLRNIWGSDNYFTSKSMDVYLTKLRKYLKLDPTVSLKNIHGFGYKLEVNGKG